MPPYAIFDSIRNIRNGISKNFDNQQVVLNFYP